MVIAQNDCRCFDSSTRFAIMKMNLQSFAHLIEYQIFKADASREEIDQACARAVAHEFHSVCVHGSRVIQAAARLEETEVKLAAVVGFPLGAMDADAKRYETEVAIDNGAQEISVVINNGWLKDGNDTAVLRELRDVVEAADERPVGVILEAGLLTREEQIRACQLVAEAGAKSIITSSGFRAEEATIEEVKLFRQIAEGRMGVTAAGRISDAKLALSFLEAGATRIGTIHGAELVESFRGSFDS